MQARQYLRGAAGCWGSLALEGCVSVSGTLAAVAHVLCLLTCRAPQVPDICKAAVLEAWAPDALDCLRPAGSKTLWLHSCELRNMKQEQCAALAAAIALALMLQMSWPAQDHVQDNGAVQL